MRQLAVIAALAAPLLAQEYGDTLRLKIDVGGEERKVALFLPSNMRKGEVLPLIVALPDTRGKAFLEIGQWQQPAYDQRFAVFSVDIETSGERGWHPKEQLEMQRDMEAVVEGLKVARQEAANAGVELDDSAVFLTGHSGGTYLAIWLGIRRPDLFLAICGRSCVFHKEAVEFTKFDKVEPDKAMRIFLYYGEVDHPRVKKETELAKRTLEEAGYTRVQLSVIPGMAHEPKPEVFLEWYEKVLKETEKARKESRKIRVEVEKLRAEITSGKAGAYSRLAKLVEREKKAGAQGGAAALLGEVLAEARKKWENAENLEADQHLAEAVEAFQQIEKDYTPLGIAKEARDRRVKITRSDAFKAAEMLAKAKELIDKGDRERAVPILEKIVDQYGETPSADEARLLLTG